MCTIQQKARGVDINVMLKLRPVTISVCMLPEE